MMKTLLFASCLLAAFSFTACESDDKKMTDEDAMLINMAPATPGAVSAGAGGTATPVATPSGVTQSVTAPATQAAKTAAALNPAHGEPGHRCDIAVGAPLDSPPTQPAGGQSTITPTPQATQPTIQPVPQPAATPAKVANGMNPPHGEPGHRCEIPVGAPLNDAPAK